MKFVGLTNDPARRRADHAHPKDWKQLSFSDEAEARKWLIEHLECPDYETGAGDRGWKFGYTYTIQPWTRE